MADSKKNPITKSKLTLVKVPSKEPELPPRSLANAVKGAFLQFTLAQLPEKARSVLAVLELHAAFKAVQSAQKAGKHHTPQFVAGGYRPAFHPDNGERLKKKATLLAVCQECGEPMRRATSDAWQSFYHDVKKGEKDCMPKRNPGARSRSIPKSELEALGLDSKQIAAIVAKQS